MRTGGRHADQIRMNLKADPTALNDEDLNVLLCLLVFAGPVTLYKDNFMYGLLM